MTVPFHPRSATRSTIPPKKDAHDDDLYPLETATTAAQTLPMSNLSKCRPPSRAIGIAPVSSKQGPLNDSLVDRRQEPEEPIMPVPGVIGRDKPDSGLVSQNDTNAIFLQSSPSGHRQPHRARTNASHMVADLGEAGSSNSKPQRAGPSHQARFHLQHSAHYSSPRKLQGENNPIRAPHALPRPLSSASPLSYAVVGSVIAVRKANYAKQQWNIPSPGIVIGYNFTEYFVGTKLFSYVVVLGTPVGDIVSNFAPYYGEVGMLNTGKAVFPPLVHKDVVQRKEALHTVYARVFLHPRVTPNMVWQKARIISRPNETPIRVRLLHGDLVNHVFSAIDLLPYTQDSYTAIVRGGDNWKTVAVPSQII